MKISIKFWLVIIVFLQNSLFCQAQSLYPFTLEGIVEGKDSGYVYLNYIPNGDMGILDSSKLNNGHFLFKGNVSEPTKAWFSTFGFSGNVDERNLTEFYIEPVNMKLSAVINHFRTLQLTGSVSDSDRVRLAKIEMPIETNIQSTNDSFAKYNVQYKNQKDNELDLYKLSALLQKRDSFSWLMDHHVRIKASMDSEFIVQNPNSYVAADMLAHSSYTWIAFPSLDILYDRFSKYIQQSFPGKMIKHEIDKEKQIYVGSHAKKFISIDSKGDTIRLTDYKGKKYVLLDFGASWCAPCRRIIPDLKKEYAKYDTAFEIISIANQDQEDDWHKAIRDDKLEWPQIIENKKIMPIEPTGITISEMYYIDKTPSLILIDRESQIIGKYGGFYYSKSDYLLDLVQKLSEIFRK
jgi:thiol-disulfide isomerase/thioredoxin